jgi:1-deoxy-D-xylulose-5-phosphate reductoisomerase
MKLPISYALFWPERVESKFGALDITESKKLTFEKPDFEKFISLKLGFEAAKTGQTAPAIFNAANEIAVNSFLNKEIKFTDIPETIEQCLEKIVVVSNPSLEDILQADKETREMATTVIGKIRK